MNSKEQEKQIKGIMSHVKQENRKKCVSHVHLTHTQRPKNISNDLFWWVFKSCFVFK